MVSTAMIQNTEISDGKIEKRVLITASPEVIFGALTDPADLSGWFCDHAICDPREGGELIAHWKTGRSGKSEQTGRAVFTRIVDHTQIEMRWIDDGGGPSTEGFRHVLSYSIQSGRSGSEVLMCDEGYPPPDRETLAFMEDGWNTVLMELKDFCERKERVSKNRALENP
jgi:uncharacterized protein YndB with AHSA1/START domain